MHIFFRAKATMPNKSQATFKVTLPHNKITGRVWAGVELYNSPLFLT